MKEKIRKKRDWLSPMSSSRLHEGEFHLRFQHLRKDRVKFFEYYRMSVTTFDDLLADISSQVSKSNTNMRMAISPAEKLASTLRYLGSGCTFCDIHKTFRLGTSTIGAIVREVCSAIWQLLVRKYMPVPTVDSWHRIAEGFEKYSNFPNCIGAIDGKYIQIMKNASIILLAVADTSFQFIYIYVCPDIKRTDSTVFERSSLWQKLSNGTLNLPKARPLFNSKDRREMPFVFVGEKVVRLSEHILRPYASRYLPEERRVFNFRLERARRSVECAFAILSNKWRIFQRPLNVANDLMKNITKACCVLHNYVIQKEGYVFEDTLILTGIYDLNIVGDGYGPRSAYDVRDYYAKYFYNDDSVPWQSSCLQDSTTKATTEEDVGGGTESNLDECVLDDTNCVNRELDINLSRINDSDSGMPVNNSDNSMDFDNSYTNENTKMNIDVSHVDNEIEINSLGSE